MLNLKNKIRKRFPAFYMFLAKMKAGIYRIKWNVFYLLYGTERHKRYGKLNSDKTIYIIRINCSIGLFGCWNWALEHIRYAESRNMVPVIDMQTMDNFYRLDGENIWEKLFDCGGGISEAYNSQHVVLSSIKQCYAQSWLVNNQKGIVEWYTAREFDEYTKYCKKYLKLQIDLRQEAEEFLLKWFLHRRVLGVSVRGTDYTNVEPYGHPIQPDINRVIEDVKCYLEQWGCDSVYLSTEDKGVVERFLNDFGNKVILYNEMRYEKNSKELKVDRRENDKFLTAKEYVLSKWILSQCNCFIGAKSGGNLVALGWNGKQYERVYLYDLGYYKMERQKDNSQIIVNTVRGGNL